MDGQHIVDILRPHVSQATHFSIPTAPEASIGVQRWTEWKAPTFSATVKPVNVQDLQAIVKNATINKISFLGVASGHGYSKAYATAKDILEIDLTNFKSIQIDAEKNTVTIGAAVKHNELFDPLFKAGKQMRTWTCLKGQIILLTIPTAVGACSSTGVIGVTLGGGLNRWQGIYGLMIDSLLEVQLVTASGDLVTASKVTNPELFWGMRGAGFNFGVVVSATYQIYDLINAGEVMVADLVFPFEKSLDVVKILKQWEGDQPEKLAIGSGVMWNPDIGGPCHLCSLLYHGPEEEGMKYVQPLLDLGAMVQNVYTVPWNEVHFKWGMGVDAALGIYGGLKNLYSAHLKQFDLATFEWYFGALNKLWNEYPACRGTLMFIEDWPTKRMAEIPDDDTAFPHRDVLCQMIILCATEDPSLGDMLDKWGEEVRDRFQATNGFDTAKVYVSYAQGDESQEAMYGERKLERLRALKRKWDPEQVFRWNNAIKI
jgi:UDP-N-acetylenolpyruvoylglucosamine reductase